MVCRGLGVDGLCLQQQHALAMMLIAAFPPKTPCTNHLESRFWLYGFCFQLLFPYGLGFRVSGLLACSSTSKLSAFPRGADCELNRTAALSLQKLRSKRNNVATG